MRTILSSPKNLLIFLILTSGHSLANSGEPNTPSDECGTVTINYQDSPELTRAEKLALMERAFYESLNKFEDCNTSQSSSSSSASSASDGSAASETLQGAEPEEVEKNIPSTSSGSESATGASGVGATASSANGKIPEDIPPAANDDAIAAQIRAAAKAEPDPVIRKKLWNEYKKYKGIEN